MGKKKHKKHSSNHDGHDEHVTTEPMTTEPMKNKEFRKLVKPLHVELVAMQEWVRTTGAKVCIVFEGRDTAGKGGVIKSITERVSPRVFRVVALPAPTEREKSQMYIQRYVPHLPARARSSSSIAAGTTAPGSSGSWASAPRSRQSSSSPRPPSTSGRSSPPGSSCSSTGSRSARVSRHCDSRAVSTIHASIGSCRRWTSSRTRAGTTTPVRATTCSASPTPAGHRVRREHRRQETRSSQRHPPHPRPDSLHPARPPRRGTPQAEGDRLRGTRPAAPAHPHAVLTSRHDAAGRHRPHAWSTGRMTWVEREVLSNRLSAFDRRAATTPGKAAAVAISRRPQ